ncbi:hypothetical protein ACH49M_03180 [Rhodococcus qingshengii]|jgi:hypothetical protein|uniref:Uncharacterized protein n=1 Tax=Rhodococcus qingshengii TaxID=334542 RepID=A0A069JHD9_RHOSG|nr:MULTISPECIES: hypothetical protein [Rhodococcus]EEN86535.1 hypothetical protein RHOER0001_3981 [Rhodococcus erythropolis SK121]KLN73118.1 hypothetical protein ABM90_02745 [Rhodococcus erythropolis]NHE66854.1 hypothetical protein [Rhodococcus sp. D-46]OCC17935.1 hypothetical protein AS590_06665 [Prescottella equi]AZI60731.1 hypothetical protein EHW12_06030 [Rhodococcus sp. NJ-530]
MNDNARDDDHSDGHYTATGPTKHARAAYQPARTRLRRAAPSLDVVAAAEYLLTQPDAYLYRRRYLDLITQTPGPDGTSITDYAAAERYLLVTATAHRRTHSEVRPLPAPGDFL